MNFEDMKNPSCIKCGGICCKIYLHIEEGGIYDDCDGYYSFDEWVKDFHFTKMYYNVQALYDSHLIHIYHEEYEKRRRNNDELDGYDRDYEQELLRMKQNNLSKDYCEYRHPEKGCIVPANKRNRICSHFNCPNKDILDASLFSIIKEEFKIPELSLIDWKYINNVKDGLKFKSMSSLEEYRNDLIESRIHSKNYKEEPFPF